MRRHDLMAVPWLGFVLLGVVDVKLLLYRCKSTLSLQLYGFCLKEGKFTASLLASPNQREHRKSFWKGFDLPLVFVPELISAGSLSADRQGSRERDRELARLHMQQLPLPQQKPRQRAEPGLSASQRLQHSCL